MKKEQSKEILYRIEGDRIFAPITEDYSFSRGYLDSITTTYSRNSHVFKSKYRESIEDLIEDFMDDPYLFSDFLYRIELHKSKPNIEILKSIAINFFEDREPYRINETLYDCEGIYQLILAHPKYAEYRENVEKIRKLEEKKSAENEEDRKKNIKKNNYEMWKLLQQKKDAGEFDEFIDA